MCVFVCERLRDGRDSGALILTCVGVSQFMQLHLRVLGYTDSLGLEIISQGRDVCGTLGCAEFLTLKVILCLSHECGQTQEQSVQSNMQLGI